MAQGKNSDFVRCSNGHLYEKSKGQCPFCPQGATVDPPTQGYNPPTGGEKTEPFGFDPPTVGGGATQAPQQPKPTGNPYQSPGPSRKPYDPDRTGFGGYDPFNQPIHAERPQELYERRLTGVLFTNSIDSKGVVFNLYEGRNLIGRNDANCSIKIPVDTMMSGKHALLLVRGESFILRDEMSSHGTFVNDEDIATEAYTLRDGDVIRMGNTKFLFRSFM